MERANAEATTSLQQGYDRAQGNYSTAQGMYRPYAEQGQQANTMYGNALGLNGVDAQKSFGQNYAASDPFRQQNADFATNALMRQYNARGQTYGGSTDLAISRANLERGSQDYNSYLNRLQGQGQQGYQATGAQAGIEQAKGDLSYGYGQQRAGNSINFGNALAQTRSTGVNNIIGGLGAVAGVGRSFAGIPSSNMRG